MEQRISPVQERRLTSAIERAATLASVNDKLDRDQLLADQLKKEAVDARFAKVASAAFNKRITVLTFNKTADDKRALPFQLTDDQRVYELLSGEKPQVKQASVESEFVVMLDFPTMTKMKKTASAPTRPRYEDRVDRGVFMKHLEGQLEKHASLFSIWNGRLQSLDSAVKDQAREIADYFQKNASSSFEFTTLVNAYGDKFQAAMKDVLPPTTDYTKTASAAVLPTTGVYSKVAKLLKDRQTLEDLSVFVDSYARGLDQFSKAASMYGDYIQKWEYHGMDKKAGLVGGMVRASVPILGGGILQGTDELRGVVQDTNKALKSNLLNAQKLYEAGDRRGMDPNEVLDADFLVKDRYRDRLLGWSDMTADPQFSIYPAEQVFQATQRVMDMDPSMERPDRRQAMRAQVAQLLAQNNRAGTADIAALATTLKALSASGGSAADIAKARVDAMEKVDKPEVVELQDVMPQREWKRKDMASWVAGRLDKITDETTKEKEQADKELKERWQQAKKDRQAIEHEQDRNYTLAERKRLEAERKQKQLNAPEEAKQKEFESFTKFLGGQNYRYDSSKGTWIRNAGSKQEPNWMGVTDQQIVDAFKDWKTIRNRVMP